MVSRSLFNGDASRGFRWKIIRTQVEACWVGEDQHILALTSRPVMARHDTLPDQQRAWLSGASRCCRIAASARRQAADPAHWRLRCADALIERGGSSRQDADGARAAASSEQSPSRRCAQALGADRERSARSRDAAISSPARCDASPALKLHPVRVSPRPRSAPTNLSEPLSDLIGRKDNLAEVLRLVAAHRLVTLTGAGGIGRRGSLLARTAAAIRRWRLGSAGAADLAWFPLRLPKSPGLSSPRRNSGTRANTVSGKTAPSRTRQLRACDRRGGGDERGVVAGQSSGTCSHNNP